MSEHKIGCVQHDCDECKAIQQRLALKDREIMRLREAFEEIVKKENTEENEWDAVEIVIPAMCAIAKQALFTPATYDDLMAWHEEQLGKPVAWKYTRRDGQVTATVNPDFALIVKADGFEVTPLYAKKG